MEDCASFQLIFGYELFAYYFLQISILALNSFKFVWHMVVVVHVGARCIHFLVPTTRRLWMFVVQVRKTYFFLRIQTLHDLIRSTRRLSRQVLQMWAFNCRQETMRSVRQVRSGQVR